MADAKHYDVAIVGGGVAGCALAYALSTITSKSWSKQISIALLERSLAEPDRIVGELLQPGGVIALRKLGMEECLEGIGAIPVKGYCVVQGGEQVHIPYPEGYEGRSFHHGRFIQALRSKARTAVGVDVIEATVQELVEDEKTGRVTGVRATRKGEETKTTISADLVVMADGCFSNFRSAILGDTGIKPALRSHFIGAIMKDAKLPIDKHGTVALVEGSGPVLMYQIAEHDTRILIDIKHPLPNDLKVTLCLYPALYKVYSSPFHRGTFSAKLYRSFPLSYTSPYEKHWRGKDCDGCQILSSRQRNKVASKQKRVWYSLVMRGICGIH